MEGAVALMNRRIGIVVIGIALVLGSLSFNLGSGLIALGIVLIIFAGGTLVWDALRPHREG
jgi:hypothetical protein